MSEGHDGKPEASPAGNGLVDAVTDATPEPQTGHQGGNQGDHQDGNQGGHQDGHQGDHQPGHQDGNQPDNQGGHQDGHQGDHQDGNQGGHQGDHQVSSRPDVEPSSKEVSTEAVLPVLPQGEEPQAKQPLPEGGGENRVLAPEPSHDVTAPQTRAGGSPLLDKPPRDIADLEEAEKPVKYPKVVFFIISNEFCERFSYYGMRTILSLFLTKALLLAESDATVIYHVFAMFCYFFPLLGAIIADSWLGKFYTIAYLSVVYALGNVVISLASATSLGLPSKELSFLGLLLISIGTGGIKPCVSSFGGDQFVLPQQARQLASFFSVFYFSINAGSLISTWLTPELRSFPCLDQPTCFPLAFGVPAILMIVSLIIFVIGKPGYKIIQPKGNVLVDVVKCMANACSNKMKSTGSQKQGHWLDYADSRFSEKLRSDIRAVLRVLLLFVPLPIFWALYDQQGSRWTFQANNMNGRFGSFTIKPDQMQVVNPLLILLLLPVFEAVVYPALNKCHLLVRPLQKMATGGIIAAIAFVISGVLELQLEANYPVALTEGQAQLRVFNALPCDLKLSADGAGEADLGRMGLYVRTNIAASGNATFQLKLSGACIKETQLPLDVEEKKSTSFLLYAASSSPSPLDVLTTRYEDDLTKDSNPQIRVLSHITDSKSHSVNFAVGQESKWTLNPNGLFGAEVRKNLGPDDYTISLDGKIITKMPLDVGGIYTVLVSNSDMVVHTVITPNVVNLMWLLPQYIVMTVAEVMFSVTGLEFAYSQAPISMKSVLASAWLLTVAFGNLIVVLITEIRFFSSQASEFFLFAGLMLAVMVLFIWLAMRYTYVENSSEDEDSDATGPAGEARQMDVIANGEKSEKS